MGKNYSFDASKALRKIEDAVDAGVGELAIKAVAEIKLAMKNTPDGRDYTPAGFAKAWGVSEAQARKVLRGMGYVFVRPSSRPGEAPAIQSGRLAGSMQTEHVKPLLWKFGTNVKYAPALEFGHTGQFFGKTVTVEPRPFMRPAVLWAEKEGRTIIANSIRRRIGR